jgi:subtilisin family serine protease
MPNHIDLNSNLLPGLKTITNDIYDHQGHSSNVCGIIAACNNDYGCLGVAPLSKILTIKVLDDSGTGSFESITDGINLAIENKVDIISMSLGIPTLPPQSLYDAILEAYNQGIVIIAAAGNEHKEQVDYPANYDEVIAVAAVDQSEHLAEFSCYGSKVELSAPGVDIYSCYLNNTYSEMSGTSQATPFISGVVALLISYYKKQGIKKSTTEILQILDNLCIENGVLTKYKDIGYGIPNMNNFNAKKMIDKSF